MQGFFLKLLNMSISAGWLILAVVLIRLALKKAPKWFHCMLWVLVAVRLICPVFIESRFSLLPDTRVVNVMEDTGRSYIQSGIAPVDRSVNAYLSEHYYKETDAQITESVTPAATGGNSPHWIDWAAAIWLTGTFGFFLYALISYLRLQERVRESVRLQENIFLCDRIDTPFILGIVRPRIFLPSEMNEVQIENVTAHERAHISRRDYLWKPFGYLLLSVYWFHPLCILAYILLCRDIEMACDEKVIRGMDTEEKKEYSMVLLTCSVRSKLISVCPLAFGEVGVKERIKSILHYKKPALWVLITSTLICTAAAVCFLTNPENNTFQIGIRIPANSGAGFYYSDQEISPQKKTILVSVGQEIGDTEVQIVPLEVTEENAYDEPVYVTPGLPSKVSAEKGAWFHIGIYAENESAEDVTLFVTVKNVEVRIASVMQAAGTNQTQTEGEGKISTGADGKKEDFQMSGWVEVKEPVIDYEMTTGADGSRLYYADDEKFIFGGYYGLFIYDLNNRKILRSIDLESIGCNATQGDAACEISVAKDGMTVFLHPMNQDQMYVYHVADHTMTKEPYNLEGVALYQNQYNGELKFAGEFTFYKSDGEIRYVALVNDITIGELGYTQDTMTSYPVFDDDEGREFEVISRVLDEVGLENAYGWNHTVDFKENADVLIKMAEDSTGEFEVYGIISKEFGAFGMLLNDVIDGEDNWNYVYEPWLYTGNPSDQPMLEWIQDGTLVFSYPCKNEQGEKTRYCRNVDCGYDTGHMELGQFRERIRDAEERDGGIKGDGNNTLDFTVTSSPVSEAYINELQEKISEAMANGDLPFVVSSAIMEDPLRLEVRVTDLTEENIEKIRTFEFAGMAITIVQSEGEVKLEDLKE